MESKSRIVNSDPSRSNSQSTEKYMTAKAAAGFISRSPGALRNLVLRRKIPYRKVAGRLYFLRSELTAWIEDSPGVTLAEIKRKES